MKIVKILCIFICIPVVAIAFFLISEWLTPQWHGSRSLGNGLYLIEWDSPGYIIVQGANIRGKTCYGGPLIIPTYQDEYDSLGNFSEWLIDAAHNERYVTALSFNTLIRGYKYYVIDKSYDPELDPERIIQQYVAVYLSKDSFNSFCCKNGIEISWNINDFSQCQQSPDILNP